MMRDTCKWQKKKSAAPIKYVVKYEFDGSPHYCAIRQRTDGNRIAAAVPMSLILRRLVTWHAYDELLRALPPSESVRRKS
jgi:hypothetical protein